MKRKEKKMAKTASDVLKVAIRQIGYCESPRNSNKTKYGKWFGVNGEPWCAIFLDWCFEKAKEGSLFPHNASAAYSQNELVSKCGGSWVMKQNTSRATRKAYLAKARPGDIVSFDFGRMDAYRSHIGIVEKVSGSNIICIEGNTTPDGKSGSQANGGMVCRKTRSYLSVCSAVRPAYSGAVPVPVPKPDPVTTPLTVDGIMGYQTKCRLQTWLNKNGAELVVDGDIGKNTVKALQKKIGVKPVDGKWGKHTSAVFQRYLNANGAKLKDDGVFGTNSVKAMQRFLNNYFAPKPTPTPKPTPKPTPTPVSNREKIANMARKCAWAYGTPRSKYTYPTGNPVPEFKVAINKAYPDRSKWGKQTRAGASCDVFTGTCVRASGVDTKFPRGLDDQIPYLKKSNKFTKVGIKSASDLKAGDIIVYTKKKGGGHICIYVGGNRICEAGYVSKRYGCTTALAKSHMNPTYIKNTYSFFCVFRAK